MHPITVIICLVAGLWLGSSAKADYADSGYQLGRGYALADSGWRLGGYANAQFIGSRKAPWSFEVNDLSLFLSWDHGTRLRFFSELEAGDLLTFGEHQWPGVRNTHFEFERFYVDGIVNNKLSLRLGKFLTPIGQWNVIHAAPLVWTSFRPVATENLFSTHVSGLMLHGSTLVAGRLFEYALYGDASTQLDPYLSENAYTNAVGTHLRYALSETFLIGMSLTHFSLKNSSSVHHTLVGFDIAWTYKQLEISSENIYRSNNARTDKYWQGFVQGVGHLDQQWSIIGRYEFFAQPQTAMGQIGLLGIAYRPLPPVIWKLEYRLGSHNQQLAPDGIASSLAILF